MEYLEKRKIIFALLYPSLFLGLLWGVKLIELVLDIDFGSFGILPRDLNGLKGIILSPLIHSGYPHLINNSIPLFILGFSLFYFYRVIAFKVFFLSYFLAGLYTWISARYNYHIGASGLVYALFGFLFISGFIRKNVQLIAISFLTAFLYGSLVWGILPWDKSISWEGHFWGLIVGLVLAFFYRKEGPQKAVYHWEEEYDEEDINDEEQENSDNEKVELLIKYHYVEKEND